MAKARTKILIGAGLISALVGGAVYIDYKRKKEAADAMNARYQEELGKTILAKAQGDLGKEQEAMGRVIQLRAKAAWTASLANQTGQRIVSEARERGVEIGMEDIDREIATTKRKNILMGAVAIIGGVMFFKLKA